MDGPTLSRTRVRSTRDARLIFHAVSQHKLPLITRRLTSEERRKYICSGSVFVWEERGPTSETTGAGIERWTDGKHWGPSRVRDEFLFYHEQIREPLQRNSASCVDRLIKQTFSVYVNTRYETRKWHLVAYFTQASVNRLATIEGIDTACPPNAEDLYRSARTTRGRARGDNLLYEQAPPMHYLEAPVQYPTYGSRSPSPMPNYPLRPVSPEEALYSFSSTPTDSDDSEEYATMNDHSRILAPLIYLQNLSAPPRTPSDDWAIRALDSIM